MTYASCILRVHRTHDSNPVTYGIIHTCVIVSLVGKNVLVTGASRGVGRELALNYCRMGANVVITARDEKKLKEVTDCFCVETGGFPGYP